MPDIVVMPEITWYVLDQLDDFLSFLRSEMSGKYLIHTLATYPAGKQDYGKDKFTNLSEILEYFKLEYIEWGELYRSESSCHTYFLAKI